MRILISGHRVQKLVNYDLTFIKKSIKYWLQNLWHLSDYKGFSKPILLTGMASGVDLWSAEIALGLQMPFIACIPFEEQEKTMSPEDAEFRKRLLDKACQIKNVRNSWMVEHSEVGIMVWDGNKGGTHNVFQQLVETKNPSFG